MDINQLTLNDFDYDLPDNKIAAHPLEKRDQSKLLVYRQGDITHQQFTDLPDKLPDDALLIFNDTRVIPARILVYKETGAKIEVFLLSPHEPSELEQAMQAKNHAIWQCMVGNKKRWSDDETLIVNLPNKTNVILTWESHADNVVNIRWNGDLHFADLLELWGQMPLPPYIKRDVQEADKLRYQTVYADVQGAVAAPTAGLHFSDNIMQRLETKGIGKGFVTLHVGAGTFKPVTVEHVIEHDMHAEPFQISRAMLEKIYQHKGPIIPVGTTAMRTLESIYWLGVQAINGTFNIDAPVVEKLEPYQQKGAWDRDQILKALLDIVSDRLVCRTSIMIMPSYDFKMCTGLITNFHLPKSTLLMLISAFTGGGDQWKEIYKQAMDNDYRFLSYGDSSLILP